MAFKITTLKNYSRLVPNTDKAALLKQTLQGVSMIRTLIFIQKTPEKSTNG